MNKLEQNQIRTNHKKYTTLIHSLQGLAFPIPFQNQTNSKVSKILSESQIKNSVEALDEDIKDHLLKLSQKILNFSKPLFLERSDEFFETCSQFIDLLEEDTNKNNEAYSHIKQKIQQTIYKLIYFVYKNHSHENRKHWLIEKLDSVSWLSKQFIFLKQYLDFKMDQTKNIQNMTKIWIKLEQLKQFITLSLKIPNCFFEILTYTFDILTNQDHETLEKCFLNLVTYFSVKRSNAHSHAYLRLIRKYNSNMDLGFIQSLNLKFLENYIIIAISIAKFNQIEPIQLKKFLQKGLIYDTDIGIIPMHLKQVIADYFQRDFRQNDSESSNELLKKVKKYLKYHINMDKQNIYKQLLPQDLKNYIYYQNQIFAVSQELVQECVTEDLQQKIIQNIIDNIKKGQKIKNNFKKYFLKYFTKLSSGKAITLKICLDIIKNLYDIQNYLKQKNEEQIERNKILKEYHRKYLVPYYKTHKQGKISQDLLLMIIKVETFLDEGNSDFLYDFIYYLQRDFYQYCLYSDDQGQQLHKIFNKMPTKTNLLVLLHYIFYANINNKLTKQELHNLVDGISSLLKYEFWRLKLYSKESFEELILIYNLVDVDQEDSLNKISEIILKWSLLISEKEYSRLLESVKDQKYATLLNKRLQNLKSFGVRNQNIFVSFKTRFIRFYKLYIQIIKLYYSANEINYHTSSSSFQLEISYQRDSFPLGFLKFLDFQQEKPHQFNFSFLINPSLEKRKLILKVLIKNQSAKIDINNPSQIIHQIQNQKSKVQTILQNGHIQELLDIKISRQKDDLIIFLNKNKYLIKLSEKQYKINLVAWNSYFINNVSYKQANKSVNLVLNQPETIYEDKKQKNKIIIKINESKNQITTKKMKSYFTWKQLLQILKRIIRNLTLIKGYQNNLLTQIMYFGKSISDQQERIKLTQILINTLEIQQSQQNFDKIICEILINKLRNGKNNYNYKFVYDFIMEIFLNPDIWNKSYLHTKIIKVINIIYQILKQNEFLKYCIQNGALFDRLFYTYEKYLKALKIDPKLGQHKISFQNKVSEILKKLIQTLNSEDLFKRLNYMIKTISNETNNDDLFSEMFQYIFEIIFPDENDDDETLQKIEIEFFNQNYKECKFIRFITNDRLKIRLLKKSVHYAQYAKDYQKYSEMLLNMFDQLQNQQINHLYQFIIEYLDIHQYEQNPTDYSIIQLLFTKFYDFSQDGNKDRNCTILEKFRELLEINNLEQQTQINNDQKKANGVLNKFLLKESAIEFLICIMLENRAQVNYQKRLLIYSYILIVLSKFNRFEFWKFINIYKKLSNSNLWILSELINNLDTQKTQNIFLNDIILQYSIQILLLRVDSNPVVISPSHDQETVVEIVQKYLIGILQYLQKKEDIWEIQLKTESEKPIHIAVVNINDKFKAIEISGSIFYKVLLVAFLLLQKFQKQLSSNYIQILERIENALIKIEQMKCIKASNENKSIIISKTKQNKCVYLYLEYVYLKIKVILDSEKFFRQKNKISQKLTRMLINIQLKYNIKLSNENIRFYSNKLFNKNEKSAVIHSQIKPSNQDFLTLKKMLEFENQYFLEMRKYTKQWSSYKSKLVFQLLKEQKINLDIKIENVDPDNHIKLSLKIILDEVDIILEEEQYGTQIYNLLEKNKILKEYHRKYLVPYYKTHKQGKISQDLLLMIIKVETFLDEGNSDFLYDFIYYLQRDFYQYCLYSDDQGQQLHKIFNKMPTKTNLLVLLHYIFYANINHKLTKQELHNLVDGISNLLKYEFWRLKLYSKESFEELILIYNLVDVDQEDSLNKISEIILKWSLLISEKEYSRLLESVKDQKYATLLNKRLQNLKSFGVRNQNIFVSFKTRFIRFYKLYIQIIKLHRSYIKQSTIQFGNIKFQYKKNQLMVLEEMYKKANQCCKDRRKQLYEFKILLIPVRRKQFRIRVESKNMVYEIDIYKLDQIIRIQNNQKKEIISRQNETKDIDSDLNIKITTNKDNFELSLNTNVYKLQIPQKQAYNIVIQTTDSFIVSDLHYKQVGKQVTIPLNQALTIHTNSQVNSQLTIKINDVKQIVMGKMKSQFDYKYLFVLFHQILRHMKLSQDERQSVNQLLLCRDSQRNSEKDRIAEIIVKLILSRSDPHNEHKDLVSEIQKIARGLNKNGKEEWDNFVSKLEKEGELFYQEKLLKNPVLKLRNIQLPDYTRPITRFIQKPQHIEQPHKSFDEGQINKSIDDKKKSQSQPIEKGVFSHKCQLIKRKGGYFGHIIVTQQRYIKIVCNNDQRPNQVPFIYGIPQDYLIKDKKKVKKIHLDQIEEIISKKFNQIANNSIEIYLKNGKSYFITLYEETTVKSFYIELEKLAVSKDILVSNPYQTFKKKKYTQYWQNNDLSNFQYLMLINKYSGRSYNDLSQPYVFPWVISNFTSKQLDLTNQQNFRDLNLPLAFLNKDKKSKLSASEVDYGIQFFFITSFHFTRYLIRFQPYTQIEFFNYQTNPIQNFNSIVTEFQKIQRIQDLKDQKQQKIQLIPQFYYHSAFLTNINKLQKLSDVKLPLWAKHDPSKFISIMKAALQSKIVSQNLPKWIDLIFGYKRFQSQCKTNSVIQTKDQLHHFKDTYYHQNIDYKKYESELKTKNYSQQKVNSLLNKFITEVYQNGQFSIELFRKAHPMKKQLSIQNLLIQQHAIQLKLESIIKMKLVNKRIFVQSKNQQKTIWRQLDIYRRKLMSIDSVVQTQKQLKIVRKRDDCLYMFNKRITITSNQIKQLEESRIYLQKVDIRFNFKTAIVGTRFIAFCGKTLRILDYQGNEQYSWDKEQTLDCTFINNKFIFITISGVIYTYNYIKKELKQHTINLVENQKKKGNLNFHLNFIAYEYQSQLIYVVALDKSTITISIEKQDNV